MKLHIGEAIRSLRKEAGLTQEQLADKLGVSYQSVSRWELGVTYPDMELLPALTECFGVSADVLLGIPKVQREKEAEKALTALAKACREEPLDTERSALSSARSAVIISTQAVFGTFGSGSAPTFTATPPFSPRYG